LCRALHSLADDTSRDAENLELDDHCTRTRVRHIKFDGKTRVTTQTGKDSQGRTVNNTIFCEKQ